MHRVSTGERLTFLEVLAAESDKPLDGYEVQHFGRLMMRHSRTHGRYCELDCNSPLTSRDRRLWHESEDRLLAIADKLGVKLRTQGDPRGYTVKLMTPRSGKYNTLGGAEDGWGVPTS